MQAILLRWKPLSYFLVVALLSLLLPHRSAEAELVRTESAITPARSAEGDRARVHAFLDRHDVQVQLETYGISVEEAQARVDSLRDEEVALIADQLGQLPAGASVEGTIVLSVVLVGVVLGVIALLAFWASKALSNASKK